MVLATRPPVRYLSPSSIFTASANGRRTVVMISILSHSSFLTSAGAFPRLTMASKISLLAKKLSSMVSSDHHRVFTAAFSVMNLLEGVIAARAFISSVAWVKQDKDRSKATRDGVGTEGWQRRD